MPSAAPLVIACDESGYEGEHLVGGVTTVFAHAGTDLDEAAAQGCVAELRRRIRSPAQEYKANHLLRAKHRDALEWVLRGLVGRASVLLVDKAFLVTTVLAEIAPDGRPARERHRCGMAVHGPHGWAAVLLAVEAVLRARDPGELAAAEEALRRREPPVATAVAARRAAELSVPPAFPPLDPLLPAIGATVRRWSAGGPVALVHDRQTTLTPARIAALRAAVPGLAGITPVPSRSDARVQVADFVAGVAYRIAADALACRGDPALLALLRPYVDPASVWADTLSGAALGLS